MKVHLVDGTYELFRAYFGAPKALHEGVEVGATRGIMRSLHSLLREDGVTHVAIAFDTVIESFRNDLFDGYKTSFGVPDDLMSQFPMAEQAAEALGVTTWRMIEFEADDALATFAARANADASVEQVIICSPDKDLRQCVRGSRVVCLDRMRRIVIDEPGVVEKFGIPPSSIPDWLALVGDDADGYPGLPRWGARSAATVLAHYGHIEAIPDDAMRWKVNVRSAAALAETLRMGRAEVALYKTLATLREDVPLTETIDDLRWQGARRDDLAAFCATIGEEELIGRIERWR
jgi:5'-3' exonuclease